MKPIDFADEIVPADLNPEDDEETQHDTDHDKKDRTRDARVDIG